MMVRKYYKMNEGKYCYTEYDDSFFGDPHYGVEISEKEYNDAEGIKGKMPDLPDEQIVS